jgi:hypothetical protein
MKPGKFIVIMQQIGMGIRGRKYRNTYSGRLEIDEEFLGANWSTRVEINYGFANYSSGF